MQQYSIITFKDANVLSSLLQAILQCLTDKDLPVQVEAGIAIRHILHEQEEAGMLNFLAVLSHFFYILLCNYKEFTISPWQKYINFDVLRYR